MDKQRGLILQDWITQVLAKVTGRVFLTEKESSFTGPTGDTKIIKDQFIEVLAL